MTSKRIVELKRENHNGKDVLMIRFPFDKEIWNIIKLKSDSKWSQIKGAWYVPWSDNAINEVKSLVSSFNDKDEFKIGNQNQITFTIIEEYLLNHLILEKLEKYKRWLQSRRYSANTIKTYSDSLKVFFTFNCDKSIETITNQDVIDFNNDYIFRKKLSATYQNQFVSALKLFFRKIENREIDPELIHRPKRPKPLPNVLNKEEVKSILESTQNLKHKAMLSITYACGLRCGEVLKLKEEHLDYKRKVLIVKDGKGYKDRIAPLSEKIITLIQTYLKAFKPMVYLFEGIKVGEPYDARSFQQVIRQNTIKAGIKKPVTLHWLRHSFATHLMESGTDTRYIQEILGHKSSKTTEIYTHVSRKSIQNISSPFDDL